MQRNREQRGKKRFSLRMKFFEILTCFCKEIFVGNAPFTQENRIFEVFFFNEVGKAIVLKEAAHLVEKTIAAVVEARLVAALCKHAAKRCDTRACFGAPHNADTRKRRKGK